MLWSVPGIQQMTINIIYYIRWVCTWFTKQWGVTKGIWTEELYVSSWNSTVNNLSMKRQFSRSFASDSLRPQGLEHTRLPCPSPTPGAYSNSCPSHQWCRLTISSSVVPFSSCPQSFPASGSFPMTEFFASGGQIIGVSAWDSVLPMNIQDWSPLGLTGWISLQSKGLLRVFSNTTVQKHQFFSAQLYL